MNKNYKLKVYTEHSCPPCEQLGTYPTEIAALKGYEFEQIMLTRNPNGVGWSDAPSVDFWATPWFHLINLDDLSTVDSFYGVNKARLDSMMEL
jgi:hypothetical protein